MTDYIVLGWVIAIYGRIAKLQILVFLGLAMTTIFAVAGLLERLS